MVQPLRIVAADERADAKLLDSIADWCDRFTPLVSLDAPDGLLLDITGAAHLFGGEAAMLSLVVRRIGEQGFAVQGAIAGTSLAARALARYAPRSIVPPGGEAAAMAPLPITALDCDDRILRALRHAGLKTIGMVAARIASELSERLGRSFVTRLRILLGEQEQPLTPRRPLPDLMVEQRFAEPIVTQDAIAASLLSLAQSLSGVLEREGRGVRVLEAAFFRADGQVDRIAIKMGEPLRDPAVMLRLLRQKLDALIDPLDAGFGFDVIRLEALLAEETNPATISFDTNENARRQIGFLVDRLSVRFGEHRVQRFVPQDTHIPEAAAVAVPAQDRDFTGDWRLKRAPGDPPRRPLRLLERPEEINVPASEFPEGAPKRFRWRKAQFDVTRAEGPERIAMDWWKREGLTRDYFRVETGDGQRFWLYRDGLYHQIGAPRWYMQGVFA
ncbi:MAG: polymerase family protein [Alphaproteobacteria bacterium]|nr:polymerase family protein [Alphaproteobacteria bacterium]MDB5739464.1 polymerase family protein [Alphaproteobacteria bacterium]